MCQQTGHRLSHCYDPLDLLEFLGNPYRLFVFQNEFNLSQYDTESKEIFHCSDRHR